MKSISIFFFVFAFVVSSSFQVFAKEWTAKQIEILNMEEKYWGSIIKEPNIETYKNLLHGNMSAWPAFHKSPKGKLETANFVNYLIDNDLYNSYKIAPKDITIYSNIAIIFYDLEGEGKERSDNSRVIHIWIKENGDWHMIGGMSASYDKLPRK